MTATTVQVGGPVNVVHYGGSGRPVVLVHGLGGSLVNWDAVGPGLSEHGRVVALDLIGHGWTPPEGRSPTVRGNRDLLIRFLRDEIGEPAVLVGNSMGGLLSLLVASSHPELVDRLILVCPALPRPRLLAPLDPRVALFFSLYMVPGLAERVMRWRSQHLRPEGVVRQTLELCTVDIDRVPGDVYRAHEDVARARATMPWAQSAFLEAARSLVPLIVRSGQVRRHIDRVEAPALIVQGEQDRLVAVDAARQVAAHRDGWDLVVIPDVGHVPQLEVPDRFLEVVGDWLQRSDERAA